MWELAVYMYRKSQVTEINILDYLKTRYPSQLRFPLNRHPDQPVCVASAAAEHPPLLAPHPQTRPCVLAGAQFEASQRHHR